MQEENHSLLRLFPILIMVLTGHFLHQNHLIGCQRNGGLQVASENFSGISKSYCRYPLFAHGKEYRRQHHMVMAVPDSKRCWGFQSPNTSPDSPDKIGRILVNQRAERLLDGLPHQILYVLAQRVLVDLYDVRRHDPCPFVNDMLSSRQKSYDGARVVSAMRMSICERNYVSPCKGTCFN